VQQPTGTLDEGREDRHPRSMAKKRPLIEMRKLVCRTHIRTNCMRVMHVVMPADLPRFGKHAKR